MSSAKRVYKQRPYSNGKNCAPVAGDEREGNWPRERLIKMDEKFRERMKKALADGREKLPTGSGVPLRRGIGFVSGLQFRD
jgi:hypothetical protein